MQAADRRGEILDSAQAVFLLRGVRAATVAEITARAGVAKGTFYLYFDSKDSAVEALRERFGRQLLEDVETALKRKNRGQAVSDFVSAFIDFKVRNSAAAILIGRRPEGLAVSDSERAIELSLARFLGDGAKAGDFDVKDPKALATLLHGSLRAAFEEPIAQADAEKIRAAAQELFRAALARKHKKK